MSTQVKSVKIVYHRDEGAWWADSPDMPGFSAVGDTFDDTRKLALEDIPFYFDGNRPDIVDERMENGAPACPAVSDAPLAMVKQYVQNQRNV